VARRLRSELRPASGSATLTLPVAVRHRTAVGRQEPSDSREVAPPATSTAVPHQDRQEWYIGTITIEYGKCAVQQMDNAYCVTRERKTERGSTSHPRKKRPRARALHGALHGALVAALACATRDQQE
jgi:hypothetical protein